ncbi:hypothetical protein EV102420_43_00110 [Pseudescherichia vulneris NBRC 102420]|uniref:Uncharacterized protein n=1 Tax=Pseudescherichia vulneris NBRC 102420 TaxID=1115515 RepID=A0A090V8S9_PSEVU|nr:hypothetical protein [Pseudescherichia vulneris]GAL60533.1 hypothetical protein EV102420_43_00110 [Pseudescherichia vulneris NBRC 102420]
MKKITMLIVMLFLTILNTPAFCAGKPFARCGNYILSDSGIDNGYIYINGARPETQHITFLKGKNDYDNIKLQWMMATDQPNTWVGLEYIKRDGKAILNTEWIRAGVTGVDGFRQFATYNCVRVK